MATSASSRTALAVTTVALTTAIALWQWQQRQQHASGQEDRLETGPLETAGELGLKQSLDKAVVEDDAASLTDRSSSSESAQESAQDEASASPEASREEVMKLVLADIARRARPDPEQVKSVGFDSDEVPLYVRVVEELKAVQYTGIVGECTRCVRAIDPLPKPASFKTVTKTLVPAKTTKKRIFGKKKKIPVATTSTLVAEPFVEAIQLADGSESTTPRLASYFEVNLVRGPEEGVAERTNPIASNPCIAVGISLHEFDWEHKMPGWNDVSFGYHSDDGHSFFAQRKQAFGPEFGVGDTVGCGIDYASGRVFYTLNGKFVGHSFALTTSQLTQATWIPTVGIDSHAAVQYNKTGPFLFDVTSLGETEEDTTSLGGETIATF